MTVAVPASLDARWQSVARLPENQTMEPATPGSAPLTGPITFLLTDIEGSTRLWESHPEPMRAALARHDVLAAAIIAEHHGSLVKSRGEGDSLFAVFPSATDALAAACSLQQALVAEPWPQQTPLRVRVALHSGAADHRGGDYYGPAVNRCARLRAVAHGGQILLSQTTRDLVGSDLPEGASLRDLGLHRLKDLQQPEHLFQLLHPSLPADFPPLRSLEAFRHNLPAQLTRFIGREQQIAEVKQLLPGTRLLTLTGAGGCGKTRLALQLAADLIEEYPDGVWLVELAALADPDLVPQAVATALGVREEPGRAMMETLQDHLRARTLLLVLDNCEHLLGACARLAEALLRRCPSLRIIASSREGLGIGGEVIYRVPSLSLPGERRGEGATTDELLQYEAVRLFVDRAVAGQPRFTLTSQNRAAVAQVCRRLDGIPLAIELAAARVKALPVEQIAARLDDRFRLLTGGSRTALPRQQTLRALIDWSYDLLSEKEGALLRRLSVFVGGWTLVAAESVCAGGDLLESDVLDSLTRLIEKSLVIYEEPGTRTDHGSREARYRLLETVRQYGRERLLETGEAEAVRQRHRDWFLGLAEQSCRSDKSLGDAAWMDLLEIEHDNLRAALDWSQTEGESAQAALRLTAALLRFWGSRGHWAEAQERLAAALSRPDAAGRTTGRAEALRGLAGLACFQGDYTAARSLLEEALSIGRELEDGNGVALTLLNLGDMVQHQGDFREARRFFEEALAVDRALGSRKIEAACLCLLGKGAEAEGEYDRARALYGEADTLDQLRGHRGQAISQLGALALRQGDTDTARRIFEEDLRVHRELKHVPTISHALYNLGRLALYEGKTEEALGLHRQSLCIRQELGDRNCIAASLEAFAALAAGAPTTGAAGQPDRAARLLGAAETLRATIVQRRFPDEQREYERQVTSVRERLGDDAFDTAYAAGQAMSLDEAIAFALEETHDESG
jgi:predicted ATPase/class 3 adenylate cyclase/Tfp pilus assembly protein PilF